MINIKINKLDSEAFSFLVPKDEMHLEFWDEKVLLPEISEALMQIAQSVVESMEINAEIKDIIVTGSIAGYNWHSLSDIDLHIVLDFSEIDENFELVKRMLDQSRINWNKTHNIMIKGHEVELYFQDVNEQHESESVWSLSKDSWVVYPEPEEAQIDMKNTEKKAEAIAKAIDHAEELLEDKKFEEAHKYASKIKKKVSNMRSAGLSRDGIYSAENLAFKMLRNSKYLEKLSNIKINSYDHMMSINEGYVKDYFNELTAPDRYEFGDGGGIDNLMDDNVPAPWEKEEKNEL